MRNAGRKGFASIHKLLKGFAVFKLLQEKYLPKDLPTHKFLKGFAVFNYFMIKNGLRVFASTRKFLKGFDLLKLHPSKYRLHIYVLLLIMFNWRQLWLVFVNITTIYFDVNLYRW
jgi:hypothetical protein